MEIAAEKRIGGQFFGGIAVRLRQQRSDTQRFILILETVDEILGWEIAGGIAGVLEQVADRIVVLAVGQAP